MSGDEIQQLLEGGGVEDLRPDDETETAREEPTRRETPPATLRARVLAGSVAAPSVGSGARWLRWGSVAAALLVAVGWIGLRGGEPIETPKSGVIVVEDESLGLMHGLETFDHVGFDRSSELIAHWGN